MLRLFECLAFGAESDHRHKQRRATTIDQEILEARSRPSILPIGPAAIDSVGED
jgi:hypothetical protein